MEKYVAVTCIGRQPGSDVYVLGRKNQFTMQGLPIQEDEQEYVWVDEILLKIGVAIDDLTYKQYDDHIQSIDKLVAALVGVTGKENLISGIMVVGKHNNYKIS